MPTIRIDYNESRQVACISAGKDCLPNQWSGVRRLFEERFPDLVINEGSSELSLPWWAFLSIRDSFKFILQINGIRDLNLSNSAIRLLEKANNRTKQYKDAVGLQSNISLSAIQAELIRVGFERKLLPYQIRNVARMCALSSVATFSVPGAGKTTEALVYYFLTCERGDKLVVIAPKNAFGAWEDELLLCVPKVDFKFTRLTGGQERIREILDSNPKAIIITYHQLPIVSNEIISYLVRNAAYVYLDESHHMKKGQEGVHGSAILNLSHLPKRKLILSGTPMPNSVQDLVPQFNFLYPELMAQDNNVIERFKSIFVRTTKSELGLTPPIRIVKKVEMSSAQKRLYSILSNDAARLLEGLNVRDRLQFRRFSRCVQYMIQASSNPSLLGSSPLAGNQLLETVISEGISNKMKTACTFARNWVAEGHKVLIWSTFVKTVEHMAGLLSDLGAQFIHGGVITSEDEDINDTRESKIRDFNDPSSSCKILVANPAACSEAISLHHVCHRAIYLDRNFNAAQYLQSEDRIHRIGLAPDISTYIMILNSPGTIDESIDRRLQEKVANMGTILDDPNLNIRPLDLDEEDEFEGLDERDIEDIKHMLREGD